MKTSHILFLVVGIFVLSVFLFSGEKSSPVSQRYFESTGVFGPIAVKKKNALYEITITNYVDVGQWSYVGISVLDENKNYLYGLSDEMWSEEGRDSDGAWRESRTGSTTSVVFKEPGNYYLELEIDKSNRSEKNVQISVVEKKGGSLPFWIGAAVLLGLGLVLMELEKNSETIDKSKPLKFGLIGFAIVVFVVAFMLSARSWGYMGYYGYHHGPSFFYFGGARLHHSPSLRDGSISGSGHRGGGLSGGK